MVSLRNKRKRQNKTRRIKGGVTCDSVIKNWGYMLKTFNEKITNIILLTGHNKDNFKYSFTDPKFYRVGLTLNEFKKHLDNVRFVPNTKLICEEKYYTGDCRSGKIKIYPYLYDTKFTEMDDEQKKEWQNRFYGFLVYIYTEEVLRCTGIIANKDEITQKFLDYAIELSKINSVINDNHFGIDWQNALAIVFSDILPRYYSIRDIIVNPTAANFRKLIEEILGEDTMKKLTIY
jgi:hypothetical protein